MAVKGTVAKQNVTKKIKSTFGNEFIGEFDKKLYLWADDDGEKVQIAISMTCPKNPVAVSGVEDSTEDEGDWDFRDNTSAEPLNLITPAEITEKEKENVRALLDKLGL